MIISKDVQQCLLQKKQLWQNVMEFGNLTKLRNNKVKIPKSTWIQTLDQ